MGHVIISMNSSGLEALKGEVERGCTQELHCTLGGGCMPGALIISRYIKESFEKVFVYDIESAGFLCFLNIPKEKRFVHQAISVFCHGIECYLRGNNMTGLDAEEVSRLVNRGKEMYLKHFEECTDVFYKKMDNTFSSQNFCYLYENDLVNENLVLPENVFG